MRRLPLMRYPSSRKYLYSLQSFHQVTRRFSATIACAGLCRRALCTNATSEVNPYRPYHCMHISERAFFRIVPYNQLNLENNSLFSFSSQYYCEWWRHDLSTSRAAYLCAQALRYAQMVSDDRVRRLLGIILMILWWPILWLNVGKNASACWVNLNWLQID